MITSLLFSDYFDQIPFLLKPDHLLNYSIEICSCIKDRLQILQTITETPDFCVIIQFYSQSPLISSIQKHEKEGFTTLCDEPLL